MAMLDRSIILMALALVLAIGIERLLELLRAVEEYREARNHNAEPWLARAERLRDRLAVRLEIAKGADPSLFQRALTLVGRYLSPAPAGSGALFVISCDQLRTLTIKLACRLYGIALGIAFAAGFQLDLFELVNASIHQQDGLRITLPGWLGVALSGVAMGLGAGPVHKLITALERGRNSK